MSIHILKVSVALVILAGIYRTSATTVFPIATNAGIAYLPGGVASSGSNYLVGIVQNQTNPFVQLVSSDGALVGSLLSIGASEGAPLVAFGRTNYLSFWAGAPNGAANIYGQFISDDGKVLGSSFPLLASGGAHGSQAESAIGFDGTNYLVVWLDESNASFYGQRAAPNGTLLGSEFFIGSLFSTPQSDTHAALVFGATNYFFAWKTATNAPPGEWSTYGTFISRSGSVGTPFQINQTPSLDYNPPATAFDGTNFFVVMSTDTARTASGAPIWNLYGRLVSQSGTFPGSELLLNTNQANISALAFDGANYLVSWGYKTFTTNADKNYCFQFYNRSGNAMGPVVSPFQGQGTNAPLFGGVIYDGHRFVIGTVVGSLIVSADGHIQGLTSGAIYGAFIPASFASPTLTANNAIEAQFSLQLGGTPGINYAIQMTTNLTPANWTSVVTNSPTNGVVSFTDTSATNANRFYRAVRQ